MLTDPSLKSKIDALWDRFWSGGISNPLTAIEQMSYLLFLKRLEEQDDARAAAARRRNVPFTSVFDGHDTCRWSYWSQLPGEAMLAHVRDEVFNWLRHLGAEASTFTQHMQDAVFVIPKPSLLTEAVRIIDDLHLSEQNHDVQGDLYEYLLGQLASAGKNGQFRTPRHLIRAIVRLAAPQLNERITDPAAGTAGFLVNAYEYLLETHTSEEVKTYDEAGQAHGFVGDRIPPEVFKFLKGQQPGGGAFVGFDFDPSMVRIGAMNLMLHGIDNPHLHLQDALSKNFDRSGEFDVVLANPPFKGSIDATDLNPNLRLRTRKTELLFVELILDLLRPGGRAAVVVPDGVLFGTSSAHQELRRRLVEECALTGIVSLPAGVFKPYAGVSTGVLLFTKGATPAPDVWFFDVQADGFSLDDKRQPIAQNDLPDLLTAYARHRAGHRDEHPRVTRVPLADIRRHKYDLSLSRYRTVAHETVVHEKPAALLSQLLSLETSIAQTMRELQEELG